MKEFYKEEEKESKTKIEENKSPNYHNKDDNEPQLNQLNKFNIIKVSKNKTEQSDIKETNSKN